MRFKEDLLKQGWIITAGWTNESKGHHHGDEEVVGFKLSGKPAAHVVLGWPTTLSSFIFFRSYHIENHVCVAFNSNFDCLDRHILKKSTNKTLIYYVFKILHLEQHYELQKTRPHEDSKTFYYKLSCMVKFCYFVSDQITDFILNPNDLKLIVKSVWLKS